MRVTFIASMIAEFCRIMRKQVRRRVCRETTWYIFVLITVGCQTIQVPPAKQISSRTVLLPLTHVTVKDRSTDFTNLFCSVLDAEFSRDSGNCGQYIEDAASFDKVPLPALSTDYRLVIVEGILGSCVSNLSVYGGGAEHLRNVHHIDITTPMVDGLGSGVNNARQILAHVETLLKHDQRAIILLGYSK